MEPPILGNKFYDVSSVFTAENLLREARRQKSIVEGDIPSICILDPNGDIVDYLVRTGQAVVHPRWACYHTKLYTFTREGIEYVIVPHVVGASFAVLVAEELFVSGCHLLVSMTSAGQIVSKGQPPYFVLIERALRDEGTSYHYLPPRFLQSHRFDAAPLSGRNVSRCFRSCVARRNLDHRCSLPRNSRSH